MIVNGNRRSQNIKMVSWVKRVWKLSYSCFYSILCRCVATGKPISAATSMCSLQQRKIAAKPTLRSMEDGMQENNLCVSTRLCVNGGVLYVASSIRGRS